MRNLVTAILVWSCGSLLAGCGGGSGSDSGAGLDVVHGGGGESSILAASFLPAQPDPGPEMVTLASLVAFGDELTVGVNVTETGGITSASLEMLFDPAYVEFVEWSCGELLPPCGAGTLELSSVSRGRVIITMAETSAGTGSDANGTELLLMLTFRAVKQGVSPLTFDNSRSVLRNPDQNDIPGVSWHGGTVIVD
jgi:hypothetical protein